jgi:predicted GTPase
VTEAEGACARMKRELGEDVLAISAVTGQGIPQLIQRIVELLAARADEDSSDEPPVAPVVAATPAVGG